MAISYFDLDRLNSDDLRAVNRNVIDILRQRERERQMASACRFRIGAIAQFVSSKYGQRVNIKIQKINQKTITGAEIDSGGNVTSRLWRVSPTMLTSMS